MEDIMDLDMLAGSWPIRPADISLRQLLELMAQHDVAQGCVASARGIFYDDLAGNRETLAWCAAEPRLVPVGTIDLRRFVGYRDEIRRLTAAGVKLWRLFPEHQGWSFDHAPFRRVLSALEDAGAVLFVYGQPSAVAAATAGAQVPVILGAHFYQAADILALMEEGTRFYLSTRQLHGPGILEMLVAELGPQRLIFGSGAPLFAPGAALKLVAAAGLEPSARQAILGGNLRRLLGRES